MPPVSALRGLGFFLRHQHQERADRDEQNPDRQLPTRDTRCFKVPRLARLGMPHETEQRVNHRREREDERRDVDAVRRGVDVLQLRLIDRRLAGEDHADRADRARDAGQPAEDETVHLPLGLRVVAETHQDDRHHHREHEVRDADAQNRREPPADRARPRGEFRSAVEDEWNVSAPGEPGADDVTPPRDVVHEWPQARKAHGPPSVGFAMRSDPAGIRTPVPALKGLCPRPLDDRATPAASPRTHHS